MNNVIENHQAELEVIGPVFVGNGREISKKEYLFMGKTIGIFDQYKLYRYMHKKGRIRQFEDFLLSDSRANLRNWLYQQNIKEAELRDCVKYQLDMGDTVLERGTRIQIMECIKNAKGEPFIPGSSIKGMLRTTIESAKILEEPKKYDIAARQLLYDVDKPNSRTWNLSRNDKSLGEETFNLLNRKDTKKADAVNDVLSGLIISDSEPLSVNDLVLCQKIERHTDGTEKRINLLRECLKPGTRIRFSITIDRSICSIGIEDIKKAVAAFAEQYHENFSSSFDGIDAPLNNEVYLGGGAGFVSKTVLYPLLGKRDGVNSAVKIFENTNVPRQHKHYQDKNHGVSPHIIKCTRYQGRTLQMGLCRISLD